MIRITHQQLQSSDDFVVKSNGSVRYGTVTPDGSAILDMNVDQLSSGSKKVFLFQEWL
jgi:hypothetical protein